MLCLWKIMGALITIWKCIQVGEMEGLWWWRWMNLPNYLCLMAVDNPRMTTNKWEVMKLQLRNLVKDWKMTFLLLRASAMNGNIPRGSGDHSENGGEPHFPSIQWGKGQCGNVWRSFELEWQRLKVKDIEGKCKGLEEKVFWISPLMPHFLPRSPPLQGFFSFSSYSITSPLPLPLTLKHGWLHRFLVIICSIGFLNLL